MSSKTMCGIRTMLAVSMMLLMLCAVVSASALPYAEEVSDAGKTIGSMDPAHLLGTIAIASMALAAFLGYLLYRSQRDLWTKVITTLDAIQANTEKR